MCLCALEDHFINFFKDQCFYWLDYLCLIWHPFAGTKVTKISKMFAKCEKQSKGSLILRFFLPALVGQDKQALSSSGPLIYHVQSFSFLCISSIWKSSFAFQFCFLFSLCILKKNHWHAFTNSEFNTRIIKQKETLMVQRGSVYI